MVIYLFYTIGDLTYQSPLVFMVNDEQIFFRKQRILLCWYPSINSLDFATKKMQQTTPGNKRVTLLETQSELNAYMN